MSPIFEVLAMTLRTGYMRIYATHPHDMGGKRVRVLTRDMILAPEARAWNAGSWPAAKAFDIVTRLNAVGSYTYTLGDK